MLKYHPRHRWPLKKLHLIYFTIAVSLVPLSWILTAWFPIIGQFINIMAAIWALLMLPLLKA